MKKYSVLMSVYKNDRVDWLKVSIDSILNQTLLPDQFVIVFDGPIPSILSDTIEVYEQQWPNIFTIVKLKKNGGLANALNIGLSQCRNELVARMDSDDYSLPDRCESQMKAFGENAELAIVGGDTQYFTESIQDVLPEIHTHAYSQNDIIHELRRNSPFGHPTVMFKKSAVDSCGGYDPTLKRSQDYDLFSKMIFNGYKASNLNRVLLYYRVGTGMMKRNKSIESCKARIKIQNRIFTRKQCSILDVLYIDFAMIVSLIVPLSLYQVIYRIVKGN